MTPHDDLIRRARDKTRLRKTHGLTGWVLAEEALTDELADALERQQREDARAWSVLDSLGVTRERGKNLANAIDVLATRTKKESDAQQQTIAELRQDADARSLYDRTAKGQGFINAPHWLDLAEETRALYHEELQKRGGIFPPRDTAPRAEGDKP